MDQAGLAAAEFFVFLEPPDWGLRARGFFLPLANVMDMVLSPRVWLGSCLGRSLGRTGVCSGVRDFQMKLMVKNPPASAGDRRDASSIPGLGRSPGGGYGNPLLKFLPGESHGQRSLAGYGPQGHTELDMTSRLSTHSLKGGVLHSELGLKLRQGAHLKPELNGGFGQGGE